jgi:adenylate kinase
MKKRSAFILIGPPGSGKSTLTNKLTEDKNITAVETGNLLRAEVEQETAKSKIIKDKMSSGKIVPTDIVKDIIITNLKDKEEHYILFDGFPRVADQVESFFEISNALDLKLDKVLLLELENDLIYKRITGRRICEQCGSIYNIHFDPPDDKDKCNRCGGKLEKRKDDTPEIVKKRIKFYEENTLQVIGVLQREYSAEITAVNADKNLNELAVKLKEYINNNGHSEEL